jgi:hypothetical protein
MNISQETFDDGDPVYMVGAFFAPPAFGRTEVRVPRFFILRERYTTKASAQKAASEAAGKHDRPHYVVHVETRASRAQAPVTIDKLP